MAIFIIIAAAIIVANCLNIKRRYDNYKSFRDDVREQDDAEMPDDGVF